MNTAHFMNMISSIKKIFHIAHYDLKNNFASWLHLLSLQVSVVAILLLAQFLPGFFTISFPDIFWGIGSFDFSLGTEYYSLGFNITSFLMCLKVLLVLLLKHCVHILFPIMIVQNTLDLAFDSNMRGFTIKGPLIQYIVAVNTFFLCKNAIIHHSAMFMTKYFAINQISNLSMVAFYFACASALVLYLYLFQKLRFVGLHIFEYKLGIVQSMQTSRQITKGKILFLATVFIMQYLVIIGSLLLGSYLSTQFLHYMDLACTAIPTLTSFISIQTIAFIASNVITTVAVMLGSFLMVWYYLIEAHLYRQLISPAAAKTPCQSCEC